TRSLATGPRPGPVSAPRVHRAEDLLELVSRRDLELVVAAVAGQPVRTPPQEHRGVAKASALQVVVLHLAHPLDPQRLPRETLAGAPAAGAAGQAGGPPPLPPRPVAPGMLLGRPLAERRQLAPQLPARLHRERGRDPDVLQRPRLVEQPQEQGAHQ